MPGGCLREPVAGKGVPAEATGRASVRAAAILLPCLEKRRLPVHVLAGGRVECSRRSSTRGRIACGDFGAASTTKTTARCLAGTTAWDCDRARPAEGAVGRRAALGSGCLVVEMDAWQPGRVFGRHFLPVGHGDRGQPFRDAAPLRRGIRIQHNHRITVAYEPAVRPRFVRAMSAVIGNDRDALS